MLFGSSWFFSSCPSRSCSSSRLSLGVVGLGLAASLAATGCASDEADMPTTASPSLHALIGPEGGDLTGAAGTPFAGVALHVPAGALAAPTDIAILPGQNATPLPITAVGCGPMFSLSPAGLALAQPGTLTLPVDENAVAEQSRFSDQVKVWAVDGGAWKQRLAIDSSEGTVTVELAALTDVEAGVNPPKDEEQVSFALAANPKFAKCLAQYPDDPSRAPSVSVQVVRGDLNDGLFLRGKHIKPGLKFDMFTVQNDALQADGTPDPAFTNFGLAWYQSDLEAGDRGNMRAQIRTILLDQIFGFDPVVALAPTGTFHVGFWFNNPQDAANCGFDVTKPTPFNGEHQAGPLAMISLPNATTGLGPLCTKPDTSVSPARCDP